MRFMPKRRWFRFSLRTLLVLTAVVAAVIGFVGYHVRWIQQRRECLQDSEPIFPTWSSVSAAWSHSPQAPGLLWLFGEEGKGTIIVAGGNGDSIGRTRELFPEAKIVQFP